MVQHVVDPLRAVHRTGRIGAAHLFEHERPRRRVVGLQADDQLVNVLVVHKLVLRGQRLLENLDSLF